MWRSAALFLVVLLGGCWIGNPPKPFADEVPLLPPIAEISEVRQTTLKVLFLNAKEPKLAKVGTSLRPGETITTSDRGAVQITIKGGAVTRFGRYTEVELLSAEKLALHYGKTLVWSPSSMEIKTRQSTIVLKKGLVYIDVPPYPWASASLMVLKGTATNALSYRKPGKPIVVNRGEQLIITPWGIPLAKQKITNKQLTTWMTSRSALFKFTNQFPTETALIAQWQAESKRKPTPVKHRSAAKPTWYPPPVVEDPYSYPYYEPEPVYQEPRPVYTAPRPVPAAPPPPPPPAVVADPPPLPLEPEYIPVEPVAADPIPLAEPQPEPIGEPIEEE